MASPFAFVTLVSSDSYLPGALAQVAAIRDLHPSPKQPDFQTVCLVTPESLNVATIKHLRKEFDLVVGVEILEQENQKALQLLGRPDLTTVLTKLHIFRLTQFKKIIFLDADVLPIRPISHLFNLPHEFSAAPDVGWPDIFNSGVLVAAPGDDKFNELHDLIKTKPSWDGGDQGILNEWRGENWNRLSFTYNTTPTAAYTYAPAYERFGSQISALHFIGSNKPWNELPYRPPFAGRQSEPSDVSQRAYDYDSLVDRWFDVYDRHYRVNAPESQAQFEVKPYPSAWDQTKGSRRPVTPPNTFDMDELKRLAVAGLNTSSPSSHPGKGMYHSMPLEGRIDLMRPRKPVKEDEAKVEPIIHLPPLPPLIPSEDWDGFPSEYFSYDEALSTPQARQLHLNEHGRWQKLPTPAPHEVPPGPHMGMVPLPFTPTPLPAFGRTPSDFYASESESEGLLLACPPSRPPSAVALHNHFLHQHGHFGDSPTHHSHQPPVFGEKRGSHFHKGQYEAHGDKPPSPGTDQHLHPTQLQLPSQDTTPQVQVPQRTTSPPLLPWNPALEPPPNTIPPNAFPPDTYFANVWDQTLPKQNHSTIHGTSSPESGRLFQPPPTPAIPVSLIKQGHYRNVTGDNQDVTPSPDRHKVKGIFPWEVKPRPLPGRVFPDSDAPSPALFLSPSSQTSTTNPSTPEMRGPGIPSLTARGASLSPIHGLQTSLVFANAWDSVPSIQKYATKLVKPPPPPLAPAFEDEVYRRGRRKSRDEHSVSSRDGDDEDNADDEDEGEPVAPSATKWDDEDSEGETAKIRSRRASVVSATLKPTGPTAAGPGAKKTKKYRDQEKNQHQKRTSMLGKKHWPASDLPPGPGGTIVLQPGHKKLPSVSPPSKSPVKTMREFLTPPSGTKVGGLIRPSLRSMSFSTVTEAGLPPPPPPPGSARSRASSLRSSTSSIMRQNSNDSSVGSPASSIGPLSPLDMHATLSPFRKGGRVWDPARGVELFKKGSEEVLAKFLSMAAFAEEAH